MVRKILDVRDPLLRKISKPVVAVDKKISDIAQDLKETLGAQKDPEGVGLAASQIGKNLRIFVMSFASLSRVVINPEIIKMEKVTQAVNKKQRSHKEIMEGCLSLPNYYGPLKRAASVTIKYLDENGREKIEEFKNFYAQIVLHEIDHLNGKLFIDRLLEVKEPLYKLNKNGEWEDVELI